MECFLCVCWPSRCKFMGVRKLLGARGDLEKIRFARKKNCKKKKKRTFENQEYLDLVRCMRAIFCVSVCMSLCMCVVVICSYLLIRRFFFFFIICFHLFFLPYPHTWLWFDIGVQFPVCLFVSLCICVLWLFTDTPSFFNYLLSFILPHIRKPCLDI